MIVKYRIFFAPGASGEGTGICEILKTAEYR